MNIWYFHHYATPYSIPGLHRPFEFGTYFNDVGHNVTVFTSSYLHYSDNNMITDGERYIVKEYDGIPTVFVKTCGYASSGINRIRNMFQFYRRLFGVAKKFSKKNGLPDIIVASSPHPLTMLAGIKIAKKFGIPCICEVRDFWPEVFFQGGRLKEKSLLGKILLAGERWIYKKCDSLVFLKEGDHEYIREHKWDIESGGKINMKKCYYINNGVDLKLFNERLNNATFSDPDLDNSKFTVTYCGTIRPINQVDLLVDAAKHLDSDTQVLIYGTGNCVDALKDKIENEKIKNVKLKGYVDNALIPCVLSRSSVNILNYSAKGYNWSRGNSSNKLFEYMASGKPIISTVKMGYDLLERFSCGSSTKECTPEAIAKNVKMIKDLPESEYSAMCENAKRAAEQFDIPVLAEKYLNVINETKNNYKAKVVK